jgi:CheY-like chemotaxis protein
MASQPPIILIVDDEPETLVLLRRLLLSFAQGCEIVTTGSSVEALTVTAERRVALTITDYKMPGINGAQLTSAIKATSPATRVAIISAYDMQDIAHQARAVAADYVLPKPFVQLQLQQMLRESVAPAASDR